MRDDQSFTLSVNGQERQTRAAADMPLLYVLRDLLGENQTRFGCGDGVCGACTVIIDGRAMHA